MSQSGILSAESVLPPEVPLTFSGNTGSGSAVANNFDIVGTGSISTSVSGDTLTISNSASGTVTSVSGTTNRITSTGGTSPVIDISASYVGQSSITTLGTVTSGVWNGTDIDLASGGTNATLTASNGGIFYSTATAGAILSGTATAGQILQSGANTTPAWSTAVYPSTAGSAGSVMTSNGTNWTSSSTAPITVTGTLTSAQIKALNATPITVISAAGAGKVIRLISVSAKMNYGNTNGFTAAAAQTIILIYSGLATSQCIAVPNAQIIAVSNQFCFPILIANSAANTSYDNKDIQFKNPIATEISGNAANNNTVTYSILYQIVSI